VPSTTGNVSDSSVSEEIANGETCLKDCIKKGLITFINESDHFYSNVASSRSTPTVIVRHDEV
jgi:hypothetical protein